jgi:stage IV sporulation protein FB
LFGEPPRTQGDLNFRLLGIPIRIHPLFWLVTVLLGYRKDVGAAELLTWVVAVFVAILIHELGHATVVRAYGFQPWITLYGMGGLTSYDPDRSFRSKGSDTLGQILISLAGPTAGFLLAAVMATGILLAGRAGYRVRLELEDPFGLRPYVTELSNPRVRQFLNDTCYICVLWGLVNLLPIYPLDGGQIAREIFLKLFGRRGIRLSLVLSMIVAGMMAVYGVTKWHDWFVAILFGSFAYMNYVTLQAYSGGDF